MNPFTRIPVFVTVALAFLLAAPPTRAVDTNSTVRPGGFQFDGKISRPVLENYLSRSICIEGMLNGRGPLTDDIRMITNCGAKYVARALCLWGAENNFLANIKRAKRRSCPGFGGGLRNHSGRVRFRDSRAESQSNRHS